MQSTPRVLFLNHAAVLGGAEMNLLEVARHFRSSSQVLLFSDGALRTKLELYNVPVKILPAPRNVMGVTRNHSGWQQLLSIPSLFALAIATARHARGFDILFANSQKALFVGAAAAKITGKPLIWYLHDIVTASHFSKINRWLNRFCGQRFVTRAIANSHASRSAFLEMNKQKRDIPIRVVYPIAMPKLSSEKINWRQQLGLEQKTVVGLFGRIASWKGHEVLLQALTQLPDVHALIVGSALFEGDISYATAIQELAMRLGIAERIHWLEFQEDVQGLMESCDVVVHTSTAPEPFGRVIIEAMMVGRPVVATRDGGVLEIITDQQTGFLVTPGDAQELAITLRKVLTLKEATQRVANAGRAFALEHFSLERTIEAIEKEIHIAANG